VASRHCLAVENALKEYERLGYLTEIGEGKQLPPKLRKLEDAIRCLKTSIEAVHEEEGHIWEVGEARLSVILSLVPPAAGSPLP
jgi:hypothetical protein